MLARLLAWLLLTGDAPAEGDTPGEPPPPAAPPASVLDDRPVEELVPDDIVYRDAKELREDVTRTRQEYGPLAQTLGQLPADERAAVVEFAAPAAPLVRQDPSLAADVAFLQANYPSMVPEDRQTLQAIIGDARYNPAEAAAALKQAAGILRGDTGGTPAADGDEFDELGYRRDDPNRPLTVAEWESRQDELRQSIKAEAEVERQAAEFERQMRARTSELGYSLDPTGNSQQDLVNKARWQTLVNLAAGAPNGESDPIGWAHGILQAQTQEAIDQYAGGKRENSLPGTTGAGAPPTGERVLETQAQMDQAMAERARRIAINAQQHRG